MTAIDSFDAEAFLNRLDYDWAGMNDEEAADMKSLVTSHLIAAAKLPRGFADMANWSSLADELAIACDLADNTRYAQRSSWTVLVGKAMALHTTYRRRFLVNVRGRTPSERLVVWMFYSA
jgi:hypothetical protein